MEEELKELLTFQGKWQPTPAEGEIWNWEAQMEYKIARLIKYIQEKTQEKTSLAFHQGQIEMLKEVLDTPSAVILGYYREALQDKFKKLKSELS